MIISKLRKEITDELTTMESHFGDMDIKELSIVDRSDRLNINYKTASLIDPRKAALDNIKEKIRDAVRYFNEDFEPLTDDEKASIKSLECLQVGADLCNQRQRNRWTEHISLLGIVIYGLSIMAFPYGFLEVEITFGVVAKIMPYQVVVEILGSNTLSGHSLMKK